MAIAVLGWSLVGSAALAQYTAVPDPNFETALAVYDDIPGDGQVPTANVSIVTSLNVASSNISDLTGIAAFTSLQVLQANGNQLTTLDVSGNPNLSALNCSSNSLTSLSLRGLPTLTSMNATSNPSLACIEVDDAVAADVGIGIYAGWDKDGTAAYAESCPPAPTATPTPTPTPTATATPTASGAPHLITFVNRCKEPIWLAELGTPEVDPDQWALAPRCNAANAARLCPTGTCDSGFCSCQSDADCTFDQIVSPAPSCDTNTNRCVKSTTVAVDSTWSGRFWARTGCTGSSGAFTCETGQCGGPGNVDCTVSADVATLFELAAGGPGTVDVFDVSLVSGYNIPLSAKAIVPASSRWTANAPYTANAQIVERVGKDFFLFQNTGLAGTSGSSRPTFPAVLFEAAQDGAEIEWTNVNAACEPSGCRPGGVREHECPPALRVLSEDKYIGCNAPGIICTESGSGCEEHLDYYQCQNNGGAQDQFGNVLTLQSANGASYVCFSAADCPPGTTCELDPEFESGYQMARGAGLCTPIAQNGGCAPGDDGDPCPAIGFPFVEYQCETLSNVASNAQVCVPPKTRGLGELWWNAHDWATPTPAPPGATPEGGPTPAPTPACTLDSDCGSGQKCLVAPPSPNGGLQQCPGSGDCACWSPTTCTSSSQCVPGKCLDSTGLENADCATTETCYCAPQGIYSGTCGAANAKWLQAGRKISAPGARWPQTLKDRCPRAYSFQFDDPSSSWSCPNPASAPNDYRVVFCGGVGE